MPEYPNLPTSSVERTLLLSLERHQVISEKDYEALLRYLYDYPEARCYLYLKKDKEILPDILIKAEERHEILSNKVEYGWYRHELKHDQAVFTKIPSNEAKPTEYIQIRLKISAKSIHIYI